MCSHFLVDDNNASKHKSSGAAHIKNSPRVEIGRTNGMKINNNKERT